MAKPTILLIVTFHCTLFLFSRAPQLLAAEPILRVESPAPMNLVTGLAFSPDGSRLFAAGWDKVVRVWVRDASGQFVPDPASTFRLPIGPGLEGAINALAVSPDGNWLAVGGLGVMSAEAGFHGNGKVIPTTSLSASDRLERGTIHLFHTKTRQTFSLRGHWGEVLALQFAPGAGPTLLASAAREWDERRHVSIGAVRLWNVDARKQQNGGIALPMPRNRPHLAARRTGPGAHQIQIAIAWNEQDLNGTFRLWDIANNRVYVHLNDGSFSLATALTGDRIISADMRASDGQSMQGMIRFWELQNSGLVDAPQRRISLAERPQSQLMPYAMTLASNAYAAVVAAELQLVNNAYVPGDKMRLILIPLDDSQPGRVRREQPLWKLPQQTVPQPVVAATTDGSHVAVAGAPDHQIQIYSVARLLKGDAQPQVIDQHDQPIGSVAFVRKGNENGLRLGDERDEQARVYSFQARQFTAADEWQDVTPSSAGYDVLVSSNRTPADQPAILELRYGDVRRQIRLPLGYRHLGHAICPPGQLRRYPLLAVALENRGQPALAVYDGSTGKQLRQCSGHEHSVQAMAFSDDHRFLVTADGGNVVCVWNLADLDDIRGRHAAVTGLTLTAQPNSNGLLVSQVDRQSPLASQLIVGDRLLGYKANGRIVSWKSERDFHDFWWLRRPGQATTVIRERSKVRQEISVMPEQGIDERKPLFSLLRLPVEGSDAGWIVFSPLGPFDSSDALAERRIGWHFNGHQQAASLFSPIDQYRQEYFRSHLAQHLIDNPQLIPPAPELKRPDLALSLPQLGINTESPGSNWLTGTSSVVRLWIDPEFPLTAIKIIELFVGDAKVGSFSLVGNGTWETVVDTSNWKRGPVQIRAVVRTNDVRLRSFSQSLQVEYRIPAPAITWNQLPAATREKEIEFDAQVTPGRSREPVMVTLRRDTGEPLGSWDLDRPQRLKAQITLKEGTNRFEWVAENKNATDDSRMTESSRYLFQVTRQVTDEPPPTISLDSFKQGQQLVVDHDRLHIAGSIEATQVLEAAGRLNEDGTATSLRNFEPGKSRRVTIDEEVVLRPGRQTLQFIARTHSGKTAEFDLPVEYRPLLPTVRITQPVSGHVVSDFQERPHVQLAADVENLTSNSQFRIEILVNGNVAAISPSVDVASGSLRADVPLRVGENLIQLRMRNPWRQEYSESALVVYDPAPQLAHAQVTEKSREVADIHLSVKSPTPIDSIEVDGHRLPAVDYQIRREQDTFEVTIPDMPTVLGRSAEIRIGRSGSQQPLRHVLAEAKVAAPSRPPVVEIIDPGMNIVVEDTGYTIHYRVRSSHPIQQVDVWRDGDTVDRVALKASKRNEEGQFEYEGAAKVELRAGNNSIEVSARSAGSVASDLIAISRLARPIALEITGITWSKKSSDRIVPVRSEGGAISFPQVPSGEVWLEGTVKWANPQDPRLNMPDYNAHVWVNGFQQIPAKLEPPTDLERKFRARVILNQSTNNVVEVSLPDLQTELGSLRHFYLDCAHPVRDQRVHLLVIAVDEAEEAADQLIERAKSAIDGGNVPADQMFVYGPLTSATTTKRRVRSEVLRIAEIIEQRNGNQPGTDVVLIYYQGAELIQQPSGFFLTTRQTRDAETDALLRQPEYLKLFAVGSDMLRNLVEIGPGAYLLLLDVKRTFGEESLDKRIWPKDSRAAVLRHAWLKQRQMPPDARLISALEKTMPKVRELEQILAELDSNYDRLAVQYPASLRFEHYVPATLRTLQVGQR
jgi:WD40 repeat protein